MFKANYAYDESTIWNFDYGYVHKSAIIMVCFHSSKTLAPPDALKHGIETIVTSWDQSAQISSLSLWLSLFNTSFDPDQCLWHTITSHIGTTLYRCNHHLLQMYNWRYPHHSFFITLLSRESKLLGMQPGIQEKMVRVNWEWHDSCFKMNEQNWIEILLTQKILFRTKICRR